MQTTLRTLADLVRRRRWEAAQAGVAVPAHRMVVCSELGHVAVSGEGTAGPDGAVDSSVLRHPALQPELLRAAADELFAEELFADVALENDPSPSRAHASWRGCAAPVATAGAPLEIRAGMLLRDTTAAGPRRVCQYAVLVAVVGFLFAAFLAGSPWPFDAAGRVRLGAIRDADAVIAVLLLVPGFLYTRLGLTDRRSISGRLRSLPRAVANVCIAVIAAVAGDGRERPVRRLGAARLRDDGRGPARRRDPAAVPAAPGQRHGRAGAAGRSAVARRCRGRPGPGRRPVLLGARRCPVTDLGNAVDTPSATVRELADLARAGYRVLHEPSMLVDFEIHHVVDRPGGLAGIVARDPGRSRFRRDALGRRERRGRGGRHPDRGRRPAAAYRQADASVRLERRDDEHATFRGSERPNLTFQHQSAQLIDGVIAIEDEPRRMLLRHGLVVLDTLRHIAETALYAGEAPLLSLQCPAQLPPTNSFQDADAGGRRVDPARSASIAIRFRDRTGPAPRGRPAADRGPDRPALRGTRPRVLARRHAPRVPDRELVPGPSAQPDGRPGEYRRDADQRRAGNAADGCLPVTFVGPARPGTTHAILSFLGQYRQIGVLACSMTPLDELAFLHLQLAVTGASRARLAAVNAEAAGLRATGDDLAQVLPRLVRALLPSGPDAPEVAPPTREHVERLVGRAGDYQARRGPGAARRPRQRRAPDPDLDLLADAPVRGGPARAADSPCTARSNGWGWPRPESRTTGRAR